MPPRELSSPPPFLSGTHDTINYELDALWEYKRGQWLAEAHAVDDLCQSAEELAQLHASRWLMIPLTRSIDTTVIHIGPKPSPLRDLLLNISVTRADFVEWVTV